MKPPPRPEAMCNLIGAVLLAGQRYLDAAEPESSQEELSACTDSSDSVARIDGPELIFEQLHGEPLAQCRHVKNICRFQGVAGMRPDLVFG